jgi:hypothetical protein
MEAIAFTAKLLAVIFEDMKYLELLKGIFLRLLIVISGIGAIIGKS